MNLSPATIKREWAMARAWLYEAIAGGDAPEGEKRPQPDADDSR
ncbi:MAG: ECF-type sigma factor [Pyrinomonadaceae bacterium]